MQVKVYKGKNDVKKIISAFDKIQKKGDIVYSFGYEGNFEKTLGKKWWKEKTTKSKANFCGIFSAHKFAHKPTSKRANVRYVSAGKGNIEIAIWKDTVRIFILSKNPAIVMIKDKDVAKGLKNYWNFMWKQGKKP